MDYKHLKSGTDIRGRALGEGAVLTEAVAERVGGAFVRWLNQHNGLKKQVVAVGRDSRLSGEMLMQALAKGMAREGAKVYLFGMCTTPAMYLSLRHEPLHLTASVMVTASHHPYDRNGFKFFVRGQGGISGSMLDAILLEMRAEPACDAENAWIEAYDYLSVYMQTLADRIREKLDTDVTCPLLGLHVVVDAGNGAGGFYEKLLRELGAWTEGSQFLEPDGHFPNHIPNPENADAMASVCAAVSAVHADLGVIFDADCDRAAIVDSHGKEINRNRLIALVSAVLLDKEPGLTIVTDSVTSSGLNKFIGEWGGDHYRYKRGYRNVIDEALRLNQSGVNCPLAMETSGHAAFRENDFIDDGMYLATVLICEAVRYKQEGKELVSLIDTLKEPVESVEIRLNITDENYHQAGLKLIEKVMDYASTDLAWEIADDNREGVRINFDLDGVMDAGWFLVRMSVHDPVLPLNCESDVPGGVAQMLSQLYDVIRGTPGIDLAPLEAYKKSVQ